MGLDCVFWKKIKKENQFYRAININNFSIFITGLLISIPFYLSNFKITFLSALFESISGLTGTGFSIFENIKYLDPTLILWRSSSQWIGGLYFLVFLLIIFSNKSFNFKMTSLTYTGESNMFLKKILKII